MIISSQVTWWHYTRKLLAPWALEEPTNLGSSEGIISFGIYIRSIDKQQQFYTDRGKWRIAFPKDLDYIVKGFVRPDSLAPLLPYIPDSAAGLSSHMQSAIEGGVPRPAGAHLLDQISAFTARVMRFYRDNSRKLDTIHERVADETEKRAFTLKDLAVECMNIERDELDDPALFAVHWVTSRNKFLIEHNKDSLFFDHYIVQPKRMAVIVNTVTEWVHEHQDSLVEAAMDADASGFKRHPLQAFIQKARRLVQFSRRHRSPTVMANVGPTAHKFERGQDGKSAVCREVPSSEKFNRTDQMIIEFLVHYSVPPREMTSGFLRSAGSHIMRATGMYESMEVNASSMPLFLQEIGVVSPWENMRLLDQRLALPGHGVSRHADEMWDKVQSECEKASSNLTDSMADMRTDWGDLPVYCVDNPDAQEIDDGVSLERIPGSEDTFWVRIHVANPSAFLRHDGLIAEYAASRFQSLYVPERTYPMLPKDFTHNHFSLAPGRPSLTFSAKMNLQGDILDTNITNGTVRNVVYATHDMLREMFEPGNDHTEPLSVGETGRQQPKSQQKTLSDTEKTTFRTLRQLLLGFREHRRRNGAIDLPYSSNNSVSVDCGAPMQQYKMQVDQARFVVGDPIIHLPVTTADPYEVPDLTKRYLISTLMNLAGSVAGKWCAARNIPAVYDGTWYHPEYTSLTNDNIAHSGGSAWRSIAPPKGVSSSTPVHHAALGLDAYVKTTSPLRRYIDLLAHFQIEAALRYEKTHSTRLDAAAAPPHTLSFPLDRVDSYIARTRWILHALRDCDRASKQFWACLLLFRAFYFGESPLPDAFPVLLQKPYSLTPLLGTEYEDGYMGVISSLGVRCQVLVPKDFEGELDVLSLVDAKITAVSMARNLVIVEPVRVVKGFERIGEWA